MEMSPPLERHLNGAGQRGGGGFCRIFAVVFGSFAGNPGRVLVRPCSKDAQGNAQKPRGSSLPRWSCCRRQTCAFEEQSALFLQLRPRPMVRGSRLLVVLALLFLAGRVAALP